MTYAAPTRTGRQKHLIRFALRHPAWNSFADDWETVSLVCATHNLGIIETNEYSQFRLKSEFWANQFLNNR